MASGPAIFWRAAEKHPFAHRDRFFEPLLRHELVAQFSQEFERSGIGVHLLLEFRNLRPIHDHAFSLLVIAPLESAGILGTLAGSDLRVKSMSPSEIKATLSKLGVRPNKRLGQHFLIDRAALAAIIQAADIHRGDLVLEVGPGLGVLTKELLSRGARVIAIEQDRMLAFFLKQNFASQDVTVVQGDAATVHWHELIGRSSWKFVSNLPYSITSLALRKALWAPRPADRIVVLVQHEVAERAIARDGKTSLLSLMVALASSSARIIRRVPAGAFYPPPKVESAVLEIVPMSWSDREKRWGIDPEKIMEIAKIGFAHPRKQLASNLLSPLRARVLIEMIFRDLGLNPKTRAEDLTPDDWARLILGLKGVPPLVPLHGTRSG